MELMFDGKVILVTGGTGSFGSKFTELVLTKYLPEKLIIFSRDEVKQGEMSLQFNDDCMRYFIGDVRDRDRLNRAMQGVDIVVHSAALKQVPSCEYNPFEAVKTNIIGAQNVIDTAIDCGVEKVMAISTDKAVNPVNLYGATKLCAEKMFVQSNSYSGKSGTRFSCCRYGNVLASRGSVVPVFLQQREDGVVTVTDQRMTRFWLTLKQGAEFVNTGIDLMQGGEIFVPKIPSMKIADLVMAIAPKCEVEYVGIRSGEKLHEVLVSVDEARHGVELDSMYVIKPMDHPWRGHEDVKGATPLPEGFSFSSDNNTRWLSLEELLSMVELNVDLVGGKGHEV